MTDFERIEAIEKMSNELEGAGIRINKKKPDVLIDKKVSGQLSIHSNINQPFDKETAKEVAREFGIKSGDITLNERMSLESLVDSFSSNRVYIPALFVVNKVDLANKSKNVDSNIIKISADKEIGLTELRKLVWDALKFVRVYLVRRDEDPHFNSPLIVNSECTLSDVALKIGDQFAIEKKFAKIWGGSARFPGQEVSLNSKVEDNIQIRFLS